MRITVLGKSPAWQDAGGACSGYLVQDDGYTLLLDCGNGVFSRLRRVCDYVDVDAVLVTHLHADHFLDLVPFSYALTYAPRQQPVPWPAGRAPSRPARPQLYAPAGAGDAVPRHRRVLGTRGLIDNAFELHEYQPWDELESGRSAVRFCEVPHFTRTFAVELRPRPRLPVHLQRRLQPQR